jgi:hypothetical protein
MKVSEALKVIDNGIYLFRSIFRLCHHLSDSANRYIMNPKNMMMIQVDKPMGAVSNIVFINGAYVKMSCRKTIIKAPSRSQPFEKNPTLNMENCRERELNR